MSLPLPAEEFLTWLAVERGRSTNTLAAYRRDLRAYVAWLGEQGRSIDTVTEADIERYVAALRADGRAPASVARALVAVRTCHRFLADEDEASDPAADVAPPRVPAGLPKPLEEQEVLALLDAVVGADAVARRDRAILELLYGTGIRISELCGLSLGDLDLTAGSARVLGKGAKERLVPVGRPAGAALADWLGPRWRGALVPVRWARRDDAEAVFLNQRGRRLSRQGAWTIVRDHGVRAGLAGRLSPHVLRHSCATHMLDHGADIRVVQELLGHASISTTQVYTKVSTERLRSVYDAAHRVPGFDSVDRSPSPDPSAPSPPPGVPCATSPAASPAPSRRPPPAAEERWAMSYLLAAEQALWRSMPSVDRRHAIEVAHRMLERLGPDAPRPVVAAALLHDCGKVASGLGTFGRVAATLWIAFAGRARAAHGDGRIARYCRHEPIGAAMLDEAGSDAVTVALVAGRGDAPPLAMSALRAADDSI